MEPTRIFVSYAHEDNEQREQLRKHLSPYTDAGEIELWDDHAILAGSEWNAEIEAKLSTADVVLVLVSSNALASKAVDAEVAFALGRSQTDASTMCVIPIIVGQCAWRRKWGQLEALPTKGLPITDWQPTEDHGWTDVVEGLAARCKALRSKARATPPHALTHHDIERLRTQVETNLAHALKALELAAEQIADQDLQERSRTLQQALRASGNDEKAVPSSSDGTEGAFSAKAMRVCADLEAAVDRLGYAPDEARYDRYYVKCENLSCRFKNGFELPPVTFTLDCGKIAGVVGFNGAGKTTLLRLIAGDLLPTSGLRALAEFDDRNRPMSTVVGYVPQTPSPWGGSLVRMLRQQAAFHGYRNWRQNTAVVDHAMRFLELENVADRPFNHLSGGFKMRAAIAAALVANPQLLVLDEPLAELDPSTQQDLLWEIEQLARLRKMAVVLSSQHIPELEHIADVMIVLEGSSSRVVLTEGPTPLAHERIIEVGPARNAVLKAVLVDLSQRRVILGFSVQRTRAAIAVRIEHTLADVPSLLAGVPLAYLRDITHSSARNSYKHWERGST